MFPHRAAVLAAFLLTLACAPNRVLVTDDEVPLAAPLEPELLADAAPAREQDDPPARVVRLSQAEGAVSRQPAGLEDWSPAGVNQPFGAGDRLWVAAGARAELHAGATALRPDGGTSLRILRLDSHGLQLGLRRGVLELRLPPGAAVDAVELDTPDGVVAISRQGDYRVEVEPGGRDRVTVRSGVAEVTAGGVTVPVGPGTRLELTGGEPPRYDVQAAPEPDPFDQWCAARNLREDRSESAVYVGRELMGYQDLDGQGSWQLHPVYGTAWAPRVPSGWAPYRDGHWVWAEPWGWTWVAAEPWGFAPSHYGRWLRADQTWLWLPHGGGHPGRPVYAPALVAFVGGPGLRGATTAGGGVAWFPLGPREPYLPAYAASPAYLRDLNAGDLAPGAPLAAGGHANQTVPGAITVVPRTVFTGALPVAAAALAVTGPALAQGQHVGSAPALAPRPESFLGGPAGRASQAPEEDSASPLMVRRLPPGPVPFEARQQALAARHGRPLPAPAVAGLRAPAAAIPTRLATEPGPAGALQPVRPGLDALRPGWRVPVAPPAVGTRPPGPASGFRPEAVREPVREAGEPGRAPQPERPQGRPAAGSQPWRNPAPGSAPARTLPATRPPVRTPAPGKPPVRGNLPARPQPPPREPVRREPAREPNNGGSQRTRQD